MRLTFPAIPWFLTGGIHIRRVPGFCALLILPTLLTPMLPAQTRLLEGAEYREAARLLRRKYPVLHGVVVPSVHRLMRFKYGHTVHGELIPSPPSEYDVAAEIAATVIDEVR